MPDGKVLHIGRTIGMNYAKDNEVPPDDVFSMTGHTVGEKGSNVAKIHCFTHSPPVAMHVMSGATMKTEWMLKRAACSTCEFEELVHPKLAMWMSQAQCGCLRHSVDFQILYMGSCSLCVDC